MSNAQAIKIKTFKTHCETLYDKPKQHILNITVLISFLKDTMQLLPMLLRCTYYTIIR